MAKYKANYVATVNPGEYQAPAEFDYDPLKDANYTALAQIYTKRGEKAAQNTLGDASALNGGYGSSYAVSSSQQARNDYNQELAAQIPQLYQAAYAKYRDNVSDAQWKHKMDEDQYMWGTEYNQGEKQYAFSANNTGGSSGSSGGGRRRSYGSSGSGGTTDTSSWFQGVSNKAKQKTKQGTKSGTKSGGSKKKNANARTRQKGLRNIGLSSSKQKNSNKKKQAKKGGHR